MKERKDNMTNWKEALDITCATFPKAKLRKLIDTQQKVMDAIIAKKGGRTKY